MDLKKTDTEVFNKLREALLSISARIAIVPHVNPDGDAIGSAVGLANLLVNKGHRAVVISPNSYPAYYNWLKNKAEIVFADKHRKKAEKALEESDVLICVDFNDIGRAGKLQKSIEQFAGITILIDHHPGPENFCDLMVSAPEYSSTAELIYDTIIRLGYKTFIDQPVAECLFTGIMTDTGSFSHNISRPNTFKVVSQLLTFGINPDKIQAEVYHNFSAGRMRLLGYCLNEKMEVFPRYRAALISITKDELKKYNFVPGDAEGFVNYPLSISGIVFSALFIEKEGYVKVSFRSKGSFPANRFSAKHFNGGGHLNASGGEIKTSLEKAVALFRQLLPDYLHLLENAES